MFVFILFPGHPKRMRLTGASAFEPASILKSAKTAERHSYVKNN